jgi:hypothetical protein
MPGPRFGHAQHDGAGKDGQQDPPDQAGRRPGTPAAAKTGSTALFRAVLTPVCCRRGQECLAAAWAAEGPHSHQVPTTTSTWSV